MNRFCMNLIKAFSVSLGIYSTSSYAISNINVYYYNGNDNFINLYTKFLGKLSERSPINFKFNDAQNHPKEQVESIITGLYSGSPAIVNLVDVNDAVKYWKQLKIQAVKLCSSIDYQVTQLYQVMMIVGM